MYIHITNMYEYVFIFYIVGPINSTFFPMSLIYNHMLNRKTFSLHLVVDPNACIQRPRSFQILSM